MSKLFKKKANLPFGFGFDRGFDSSEESGFTNPVSEGLLNLKAHLENIVQWAMHASLAADLNPERDNIEELFQWHAQKMVALERAVGQRADFFPNLRQLYNRDSMAFGLEMLCAPAEVVGTNATIKVKVTLTQSPNSSISRLMGDMNLDVLVSSDTLGWLLHCPNTDSILECPTFAQYDTSGVQNMYFTAVAQMQKICMEDFQKEWRTFDKKVRALAF